MRAIEDGFARQVTGEIDYSREAVLQSSGFLRNGKGRVSYTRGADYEEEQEDVGSEGGKQRPTRFCGREDDLPWDPRFDSNELRRGRRPKKLDC